MSRPVLRLAIAAAIVLAGGSAVWSQALDHALGNAEPEKALQLGANGAATRGAAAAALLGETGDAQRRAQAKAYATSALKRDPTVLPAWNFLAMARVGERDMEGADAILSGVGALARRDLPAQLWLIDQRVREGDIAGALEHYDVALRTSKSSDELLLPVLVEGTREPLVIEPLARLLAKRPNWEKPFLGRLAESAPDDRVLAGLLERTYREDRAGLDDALMNIARRMADTGSPGPAWRTYRLVHRAGASLPLRNPSFEDRSRWPPFGWAFASESAVSATIRPHPDNRGARVLDVQVASDARGEAARQLLALRPGAYRLAGAGGVYPDENPAALTVRLVCTGGADREIAEGAIPTGRFSPITHFTVPASGCTSQLLVVFASPSGGAGRAAAWIDRLAIGPAGAADASSN